MKNYVGFLLFKKKVDSYTNICTKAYEYEHELEKIKRREKNGMAKLGRKFDS